MPTITIQIGNTDNKLTQQSWASFVKRIDLIAASGTVHFAGFSPGGAAWQNAAWVLSCTTTVIPSMRAALAEAGRAFQQDAIALTVGDTEFVAPHAPAL